MAVVFDADLLDTTQQVFGDDHVHHGSFRVDRIPHQLDDAADRLAADERFEVVGLHVDREPGRWAVPPWDV